MKATRLRSVELLLQGLNAAVEEMLDGGKPPCGEVQSRGFSNGGFLREIMVHDCLVYGLSTGHVIKRNSDKSCLFTSETRGRCDYPLLFSCQ